MKLENIQDVRDLLRTAWSVRALISAVELDLIAPCTPGPTQASEVAFLCKTDLRATEILLDALSSMDLLEKTDLGFKATKFSVEFLSSKAKFPLNGMFEHQAILWESWSQLSEVARSGKPVEKKNSKKDIKSYVHSMNEQKKGICIKQQIPIDLSNIREVLDLGGGPGAIASALVKNNTDITVTLVDRPEVLTIAQSLIPEDLWENKIKPKGLDLVSAQNYGQNYDLVIISAVLHAYGPETCVEIIKKAARSLKPNGTIVIREYLVEKSKKSSLNAALFSINMLLVTPEGRTYSAETIIQWMTSAGFANIRRTPVEKGEAIIGVKLPYA